MPFFDDYMLYASDNEAPPIYHLWSALSVISASVARRTWFCQGIFVHFPNIYVVLVGSAGSGKSTAQNIANDYFYKIGNIPMSADSETPQSFLNYMSQDVNGCKKAIMQPDGKLYEYSNCVISVEEFGHFIANNPSGWVLLLTDAYSKRTPMMVRTKNKGTDELPGIYLSILACMTPETTNSMLKQDIITTGFGRRAIFVWSAGRNTTKSVPRPKITQEMEDARARAVAWCQQLQALPIGECTYGPGAVEWWDNWYINVYKPMLRGHSESSTQSYFETKSMQLLKVAMLISLTESFEKIITIEHFERALDLLAETEKYLARVFEGTGRNLSANMAARIMTLLEAAGTPVAKKKIARDVWAMCADGRSAEQEINEVLRSLASADKLIAKRQEVTNADGLKIVTEYLGTPEAWTAFDASVRAVSKPVEEPQL